MRGENRKELKERVMPAALKGIYDSVEETQPAGGDLAARVPEPHFLPLSNLLPRLPTGKIQPETRGHGNPFMWST